MNANFFTPPHGEDVSTAALTAAANAPQRAQLQDTQMTTETKTRKPRNDLTRVEERTLEERYLRPALESYDGTLAIYKDGYDDQVVAKLATEGMGRTVTCGNVMGIRRDFFGAIRQINPGADELVKQTRKELSALKSQNRDLHRRVNALEAAVAKLIDGLGGEP